MSSHNTYFYGEIKKNTPAEADSGGGVNRTPLELKISFSCEILDKSDEFGIPYLP